MTAVHETVPPRRTLRSAGALLAGLLTIVILSIATDLVLHATGVFRSDGSATPDAIWLLATVYRTVYGVAGCYLAARLAPDRPMGHGLVLGAIGLAVGIVGAVVTRDHGPDFGPKWYPIAVLAIALPCGWIGGRLHVRSSSAQAV